MSRMAVIEGGVDDGEIAIDSIAKYAYVDAVIVQTGRVGLDLPAANFFARATGCSAVLGGRLHDSVPGSGCANLRVQYFDH
jgi:hypothetical protein